jgi:hypothetical protein
VPGGGGQSREHWLEEQKDSVTKDEAEDIKRYFSRLAARPGPCEVHSRDLIAARLCPHKEAD